MPGRSKESVETLLRHLELDPDGILTVDAMRSVILPSSFFPVLKRTGERFLGRGWVGILYAVGEQFGRRIARQAMTVAEGARNLSAAVSQVGEALALRGFGRVELAEFDPQAGRIVIKYFDCPFDEEGTRTGDPWCPYPAGFWAGFMGVLRDAPVVAQETKCKSTGDSHCEFATAVIQES